MAPKLENLPKFVNEDGALVKSHNESLRITFEMMIEALITNRKTLPTLDICLATRFGPSMAYREFQLNIQNYSSLVLRETLVNLKTITIQANVPEASATKTPGEEQFFIQPILDESPALEKLTIQMNTGDAMWQNYEDKRITHLLTTTTLPKIKCLLLIGMHIHQLSTFYSFLLRHKHTLEELQVLRVDINGTSTLDWSHFFRFLAEEMTVLKKGYTSIYSRARRIERLSVRFELWREGMIERD